MPFFAKILGAEAPAQKAERGFQRTKGVQKGCKKGVLVQKGGAQRAHKGCKKGAERVLEPTFQQKGGGVENPAKRTVSDKSENQPPKGA